MMAGVGPHPEHPTEVAVIEVTLGPMTFRCAMQWHELRSLGQGFINAANDAPKVAVPKLVTP